MLINLRIYSIHVVKLILITSKENTALSNLTKNSDGKLTVEVPTNMKYEHLNIASCSTKTKVMLVTYLMI